MNRRSFLKFAGLASVVPGLAVSALQSQPRAFDPEWITGTQTMKVIRTMSMTLESGEVKHFSTGDIISVTIDEDLQYERKMLQTKTDNIQQV